MKNIILLTALGVVNVGQGLHFLAENSLGYFGVVTGLFFVIGGGWLLYFAAKQPNPFSNKKARPRSRFCSID